MTKSQNTTTLEPDVRRLLDHAVAKLEIAQAGVESVQRHGIVNSRFGWYKIIGRDKQYQLGNFTGVGLGVDVLMACDSTPENVANPESLRAALVASVSRG